MPRKSKKKNWVSFDQMEGWAKKFDGYSFASVVTLVTYFSGRLDLSLKEVVGLVVSIIGCEVTTILLRRGRS